MQSQQSPSLANDTYDDVIDGSVDGVSAQSSLPPPSTNEIHIDLVERHPLGRLGLNIEQDLQEEVTSICVYAFPEYVQNKNEIETIKELVYAEIGQLSKHRVSIRTYAKAIQFNIEKTFDDVLNHSLHVKL